MIGTDFIMSDRQTNEKILTVGVFDLLHIGHINLFRRARAIGSCLCVAVQNSDYVTKYKPDVHLVYSTEERMYIVKSIKWVDEVIEYRSVNEIVKNIDFDVLVVGPDQNHKGFQEAKTWCLEHGKRVVELPRTEGISSSWLKEQIKTF